MRKKLTHAVLVSGSIDAVYSRDLEIPVVMWVGERSDKSARSGIDVDGHILARLLLVLVKLVRHALDRLKNTSVGGP